MRLQGIIGEYSTHSNGKRLESWVDKDTWSTIHHIFPHFDAEEDWNALKEMLQLFKRLSHATSKYLGYKNLPALEREMNQFIVELETKQKQGNRK